MSRENLPINTVQTLISSFDDAAFNIYNDSDNTKKVIFDVSNVTASTTRTITVPNANIMLPASFNSASNLFTGINTTPVTGTNNITYGISSGLDLTSGSGNSLVGHQSGWNITSGNYNTAVGTQTITSITDASELTAVGYQALNNNTSGVNNTAVGYQAGLAITSGGNNTLVGTGINVDTGARSNCIVLGSGTTTAAFNNQIRIGFGTSASTKCYLDGVRGITTVNADAVAVLVDSAGQLGTVSSSIRYKENIVDQNVADSIYKLRPVTFTYKSQPNSDRVHYGLIAEEVAEVLPDIIVKNDSGAVETVQYHLLASMLIEVVKKQKNQIDLLQMQVNKILQTSQ